jgi:predicted dehydrogenase
MTPPSTSTPRIAVIGCGSIGSRHIDTLLAMGYQDLVGVEARPMPHDERLPIVGTFEDLGSWHPTHAIICTPPEFHYHHARWFLERGIPTCIEKPMTSTALEAATLTELAQKNGTYTAVGYMERAHPAVHQARNFVLNNIVTIGEFFCYWRATEKTYQLNVIEESSHVIDTALFVMGTAMAVNKRGQSNGRAHVELKHATSSSEVIMDMDASPRRRIQLYTRDVTFSLDYGTTREEWDACYKHELQAFINGSPLCTGHDGVKVMNVLEQLR